VEPDISLLRKNIDVKSNKEHTPTPLPVQFLVVVVALDSLVWWLSFHHGVCITSLDVLLVDIK
jgi:hypothetical protein